MRVAVWQGPFAESIDAALLVLEEAATDAKEQGADVVVFPELFLGGYLLQNAASRAATPEHLEHLSNVSARLDVCLVFGYFERDESLYNSAMVIDAGAIVAKYRKTHIFGANEKKAFAAGDALSSVFEVRGVKMALMICYDVEFPEAVRCLALQGAQLVLVPTANMAPYDAVNDLVVPVRALENHCFVCYCNWHDFTSAEGVHFNGKSSVCGPTGVKLLAFDAHTTGIKVVDVVPALSRDDEDDYLRDRRADLYADVLRQGSPHTLR